MSHTRGILLLACISLISRAFCIDLNASIPVQNISTITAWTRSLNETLTSSVFSVTEKNGLSTWDVVWLDWPLISGQGTWEWYCPDTHCNEGGPAWLAFEELPATFSQSWVLMNAIRWRIPDLMSASKAEYHLTGSLSKELAGTSEEILFSKTLQLQLVLSDEPRTNSALPYSPSEVCSDPILFTETGTTALGYPFGKFTKTSPIRPLCAAVSSVPGAMSNLGDFIVSTPLAVSRLNASAYVSIGSRALPEGFVAVTFTGHQSRFGVVESMIHIQSTPTTSINLITPQLQLNSTRFINSQADVGMLLVDPTSTGMHYISASEFNNDPKSPMRISVLVPGSGYFIFGRLSANTILPIRFGMALEYIGEWGVKMFQLDELQITITSTRDLSLVVTRADIVSSAKADVQNSYSVVINGELGDASVVLSGKFKRGYAWARYDASLNTVGGKWSASTMGSSITAEKSGIYGILNLGYASSTCAIAPMLMMPAVSLAAMYWGTL